MTGITYVDHDSGATFVHGHVHVRTTERCLSGQCDNLPRRDRLAAALLTGRLDAIEVVFDSETALIRDTLVQRTRALNETGASNDQLRAELADANARLAMVAPFLDSLEETFEDCTPSRGCTGCEILRETRDLRAALGGGRDE